MAEVWHPFDNRFCQVLPEQDPYQTNFNPGDEILYVSMSRNPVEGEPPKNKVELVQNTQPHYSQGKDHSASL